MKSRTLTLRLDPDTAAAVERLQDLLEQKTASKTLCLVATRHEELLSENQSLKADLENAGIEIERLERVLNSASLAASELLERVGQRDIFDTGTECP